MIDAMMRRHEAVQSYLKRIWCSCDYDTDSEDEEVEAALSYEDHPGSSSTRQEIYSQNSDFNRDRLGSRLSNTSTKHSTYNDSSNHLGDFFVPEENKRRKESVTFSDNLSNYSEGSYRNSLSRKNSYRERTESARL